MFYLLYFWKILLEIAVSALVLIWFESKAPEKYQVKSKKESQDITDNDDILFTKLAVDWSKYQERSTDTPLIQFHQEIMIIYNHATLSNF